MQILTHYPVLTESVTLGVSPAGCILTSPPGNSNVHRSVRATVLQYDFLTAHDIPLNSNTAIYLSILLLLDIEVIHFSLFK